MKVLVTLCLTLLLASSLASASIIGGGSVCLICPWLCYGYGSYGSFGAFGGGLYAGGLYGGGLYGGGLYGGGLYGGIGHRFY